MGLTFSNQFKYHDREYWVNELMVYGGYKYKVFMKDENGIHTLYLSDLHDFYPDRIEQLFAARGVIKRLPGKYCPHCGAKLN